MRYCYFYYTIDLLSDGVSVFEPSGSPEIALANFFLPVSVIQLSSVGRLRVETKFSHALGLIDGMGRRHPVSRLKS
jgi:hypothetical protein